MAVWGGLTNSCEKKRSEKQRRKGKIFPLECSWVGSLNIIKISIMPKVHEYYRFNAIPLKIPTKLSAETEKSILKILLESWGTLNSQSNLEKNKIGGLTLLGLKAYHPATVIKTLWHWYTRHIDQWNRIEIPEIIMAYTAKLFSTRVFNGEKTFQQILLGILESTYQKNPPKTTQKVGPLLNTKDRWIKYLNIFLNYLFVLLYNTVLVLPYIDLNPPWVYMCSPSWTPLLTPSPSHSSGSSQCTSPEHPVSCIKPRLAIRFTYDNLHVSMSFSHIILPSPSPTEPKRLFNTSVSLLLSRTQAYRYHLSKFHIYALVYCIGKHLNLRPNAIQLLEETIE